MPDVLGMRLEEAVSVLDRAGIRYSVKKTAPPSGRRRDKTTETRVIRQSAEAGSLELLVCDI